MVKVTIKEVQKLFPDQISEVTASRYIKYVREALNKPKPQIITLDEFCICYGIKSKK